VKAGGRPRKPPAERRTVGVRTYLTPAEADHVFRAAREGRKSVSDHVADRLLEGFVTHKTTASEEPC
jgi:hypothetical protein